MPVKLFLSYARDDDEPFVKRLYESLKAKGFEVWFDRVSMPARALSFTQEIQDAVAASDRLVLVIGPRAVSSDYVAGEWRFAYFKALKCVNPILRLGDYDSIPEDLRGPHIEDFRTDAEFDLHLTALARQLSDDLPPLGKIVAVPELPAHYLEQRDRLGQLRDMLLADLSKPVVVSGAQIRIGVHGMAGIGKSLLAAALAHRPEIRRAFPGGVYWVTLGQDINPADLVDRQRKLARALEGKDDFTSVDGGKERLREILLDRTALLVLDDVWQRQHADAFNVIGPRCRLLLTTRDAGLVAVLASKETHYQVQLPTDVEARYILAIAARISEKELPPEAKDVISECGRLPLALAICGGMVRGRESGSGVPWRDLLEALREHDLEFLSAAHAGEEQHSNIWKAINVGLRALPENLRTRFAELAVFGLNTAAPEDAVATLWEHTAGLRSRESHKLLAEFVDRSLVQRPQEGRMVLHDLLHNFAGGMASKQFSSLEVLHQRLLDAYLMKCVDGWPSGPHDGYFLENLVHHLIAGGETDDAVALLTDLPWIETKCKVGLAFGLQEDYRQIIAALPEAQAELQEEERRKAEVARWTQKLIECAEQQRLPKQEEIPNSVEPRSDEQIDAESKRITENPTRLDRLNSFSGFVRREMYTLNEFGRAPGFVVQHAFNSAPTGSLRQSAIRSMALEGALMLRRRWPVSTPNKHNVALAQAAKGHSNALESIAITPDGRWAVSGSLDHTLRLWDLKAGICLRSFEGHSSAVLSVSVTPDGRQAVSASDDGTIRIWSLDSGICVRTLEGGIDGRGSVSMTANGRRLVSADYGTLRVWDAQLGICVRKIQGGIHGPSGVSVTADGLRAVSASPEGTMCLWDLESGDCLRTIENPTGCVSEVSITPDGRRAVSGGSDKTVQVWDLESGTCLRTLEGHTYDINSVSVTPDGRRAVSASFLTLRVWDLESGTCLSVLEGDTSQIWGVAVTSDGRRAVSASNDGTLRVWDLETGTDFCAPEGHRDWVWGVSITPNGLRAVSASGDQTLRVWDLETRSCLRTLEGHRDSVHSVSITADGLQAVSGSDDKTLRLWNLDTGVCLRTLGGHTHRVRSVCVTPDGYRAFSGSEDRTVRVWNLRPRTMHGLWQLVPESLKQQMLDIRAGRCLRTIKGHTYSVECVSATPDGRRAVSGSFQTLRVWDVESGVCLWTLEGHAYGLWSVDLTPDGRRAVSADYETVRVWDLEAGVCLRTVAGRQVRSVSVTRDGLRFVAGGDDQTLRLWDLESGACLAIAYLDAPCIAVAAAHHRIIAGTSRGEVLFFDLYRRDGR